MGKFCKQLLQHAAWAIVTLAPVAFFPNIAGFGISAGLAGLIREVTEEGDPVSIEKFFDAMESWRDLLGWVVGGIVLGAGVEWVAG